MNIAKVFRTAVLLNTFCSLYFSEHLCDAAASYGVFGTSSGFRLE